MTVEECDDDDDDVVDDVPEVEDFLTTPVKIEDPLIADTLVNAYSQRGRTTKRTTWDEIAQRSKLQTLWGVKVFRGKIHYNTFFIYKIHYTIYSALDGMQINCSMGRGCYQLFRILIWSIVAC